MNADGTDQVRLTENSESDWGPAWSPDGQRIAFASERDGNGEIYVMNANGSGQTNLTDNPAHDLAPTWSPR
jgi:Tol biopolymer transport system component